jgi:16S rRNA (cytosine967-C5)-methyltransferase
VLSDNHIEIDSGEYLELSPQAHDTDGFFAAVMQRRG